MDFVTTAEHSYMIVKQNPYAFEVLFPHHYILY